MRPVWYIYILACTLCYVLPSKVWFDDDVVQVAKNSGKHTVIACHAEGCNSDKKCTYLWNKEGMVLIDDTKTHEYIEDRRVLILKPPMTRHLLGKYKCVVQKESQTVGENHMELKFPTVTKKATFTSENLKDLPSIRLYCILGIFFTVLTTIWSAILYFMLSRSRFRASDADYDYECIESQTKKVTKGMPPIKRNKSFEETDESESEFDGESEDESERDMEESDSIVYESSQETYQEEEDPSSTPQVNKMIKKSKKSSKHSEKIIPPDKVNVLDDSNIVNNVEKLDESANSIRESKKTSPDTKRKHRRDKEGEVGNDSDLVARHGQHARKLKRPTENSNKGNTNSEHTKDSNPDPWTPQAPPRPTKRIRTDKK